MTERQRIPAIRVLMMPRDTNVHETIFGGVILSHIDQAGAVSAKRHGCKRVVTVAMDKVEFHEPVHVGDLVSFYTEVVRQGTTSITIEVSVESERHETGERVPVTSASVTFVNVDEERRPLPI